MSSKLIVQIKKEVPVYFNKKRLQRIAETCLKILHKRQEVYAVSLVFLGPVKIRSLNQQYRQIDRVTDVLSFMTGQDEYFQTEQSSHYLGDIIICPQVAKKQAKIYGHATTTEIEGLFLHGLLHLFHYDHQNIQVARAMEQLEERILQSYDKN